MSHSDLPLNVIKLVRLSRMRKCVFPLFVTLKRTLEVAALTAASDGAVNLCSS